MMLLLLLGVNLYVVSYCMVRGFLREDPARIYECAYLLEYVAKGLTV